MVSIYFGRTLLAPEVFFSTLAGLPEYWILLAPDASEFRRSVTNTLTLLAPLASTVAVFDLRDSASMLLAPLTWLLIARQRH